MNAKDSLHRFQVFGSTVVSPRGQVVIPANARKELDIDSGDTLLVFKFFRGQGLVLLKADAIEQMLSTMNERLADFKKMVKEHESPKAARGKRRKERDN